ncbi:transglycosylase SLT domain-containing protein [Pelagibius sp. CAU 1746]|uniref:transglycosylase SLT domain-containing protein n=1 Tax=Pelagibius sp. CAU 1746 TaxID=3140370 RepID=UPI00325BAC5A
MARKLLKFALLVWGCAVPLAGQAAEPLENADRFWELCRQETARAETARDLPPHLLTAIARTESGRWHAGRSENLAWPWTVMAEGKGRFLPSKAAAIEEVRRLQARGVRNIDVGCMQVNLHYHPEAFEDLDAAFDPAVNVAYAAEFLVELRREARSWTRAVGQYHSRQAIRGNHYRAKVFKAWRAERHRANRERRARLQAAREADRRDGES